MSNHSNGSKAQEPVKAVIDEVEENIYLREN